MSILIPLIGLLSILLHLAGVCLVHALRTYSRSRLEQICHAGGLPERAEEIAQFDEPTERSAEGLATLTGLLLAALLGATADGFSWALGTEVFVLLALGAVALGHVAAAVVGRVHAEAVLVRLWPLARPLRVAMSPLTGLQRWIESVAYRTTRGPAAAPRPASVEVEIPSAEAGQDQALEADLDESAREMIGRVVALTRLDAGRLMVPAAAMVALPASITGPAAARAFADSGYSRIPLYGESRDDIVGILYAKDLLARLVEAGDPERIVPRKLARPPLRVPETRNAAELLDDLRAHRVQVAIVIDEYGGVAGLISLEDILEQVTGPIQDEHDEPPPPDPVVSRGGSAYEVDASLALEALNERLGLRLPTDEDYSTLAGLAFSDLGHVPQPGETFRREGIEFTVLEVEGRSIRRLLVDLSPAASVPGG